MEKEETMKIDVLDKGFVKYLDHMGRDLSAANSARVSFHKESFLDEDGNLKDGDKKLIRFLALNEPPHFSPFTHPQIQMHLKVPIFVRNQLDRSRIGLTISEVSRRYIVEEPEVYHPRFRSKPAGNIKQGSGDFIPDDFDKKLHDSAYKSAALLSVATYNNLIKQGICPEQARGILPVATYTEFHWTGSLYAWARVYNLRIDSHAQWESQQVAKGIGEICKSLFPVCWEFLCGVTKEDKLLFNLEEMLKSNKITHEQVEEILRKIK